MLDDIDLPAPMRIIWVFPSQTSQFSDGKSRKVRLRGSKDASPVEPEALTDNATRDRHSACIAGLSPQSPAAFEPDCRLKSISRRDAEIGDRLRLKGRGRDVFLVSLQA